MFCSRLDEDVFALNKNYTSHGDVPDGQLALNAFQRRNVRVSVNDEVQVARYVVEKKCELVLLLLELQFVKFRGKQEMIDAEKLKKKLISSYVGQVMMMSQSVSFEYNGTNYIFIVKEAKPVEEVKDSIEGRNRTMESNRGVWTNDTSITLETARNSGISIFNPDSD
ncbi:unnamed protein product [Calypogeia fissa]